MTQPVIWNHEQSDIISRRASVLLEGAMRDSGPWCLTMASWRVGTHKFAPLMATLTANVQFGVSGDPRREELQLTARKCCGISMEFDAKLQN